MTATDDRQKTAEELERFVWRRKARLVLLLVQLALLAVLAVDLASLSDRQFEHLTARSGRRARASDDLLGLPREAVFPAFLGVMAVTVVGTLVVWRCPRCNRWMGRTLLTPRFCAHCGAALRD